MGTTYMDFGTGIFHVDGDKPLTQAQVDSVWRHLPTTGASWVERGHLFVQQSEAATAFDLGPVERGVTGASGKVRWGGQHATKKKSPVQLDHEISEALARSGLSTLFKEAKAEGVLLEKEVNTADEALKAFPRGTRGFVPEAVTSTPAYQAAKARFQKAFTRLRAFNTIFTKKFAKELRAERRRCLRTRDRCGSFEAVRSIAGRSTEHGCCLSHEPRDLGAATSNQGQSNAGHLLAILDGESSAIRCHTGAVRHRGQPSPHLAGE